jgi:putative transposase
VRDAFILLIHLVATVARLVTPGGARTIVAESTLLKQQLLVLNRARQRAPNLRPLDRVITAVCAGFLRPSRLLRAAIVIKPATIMQFHRALVQRKYRLLFTPARRGRPGPKGPSRELIAAIIEMKRRNPRWGCPRIARQIALAFGVALDKDVVRRILARHYHPPPGGGGPSWLTFLGNMKDSLWSVDFFRCESLSLRSHWVLLVMDQYTRRIVGVGIHAGTLEGVAVCRMFNAAIGGSLTPRFLSTDHDPLFEFHRWRANLQVLEIEEIKTVPYTPISHPFVERLIGTIRREYLDQVPFWGATDLKRKLAEFQAFYNAHRVHAALGGQTPGFRAGQASAVPLSLHHFGWQTHCRGLFHVPVAA